MHDDRSQTGQQTPTVNIWISSQNASPQSARISSILFCCSLWNVFHIFHLYILKCFFLFLAAARKIARLPEQKLFCPTLGGLQPPAHTPMLVGDPSLRQSLHGLARLVIFGHNRPLLGTAVCLLNVAVQLSVTSCVCPYHYECHAHLYYAVSNVHVILAHNVAAYIGPCA